MRNINKIDKFLIKCNDESIYCDSYEHKFEIKFVALCKINIGKNTIHLSYGSIKRHIVIHREKSTNQYTIVPIYVIVKDHNGFFQSDTDNNKHGNACLRIDLALEIVQSIYSNKLTCGGNTFSIGSKCKIFQSQMTLRNAYEWSPEVIWNYLAREIISLDENYINTKYIAFLSCTNYRGLNGAPYSYENISKNVDANPCISTGGLALLGTGCLYTWAENINQVQSALKNKTIVDIEKLLDDSNYRTTYGGCYSTSLGSLCHEIGHLFDLGHTENGIMGNGIDTIHRIFLSKNFTEILPNRIVCGQAPVKKFNKKFTNVKKQGQFITKYHEQKDNDLSFFDKNCRLILEFHKWINHGTTSSTSQINYDLENYLIKSETFPLKLVELRDKNSFLVNKFWVVDEDTCEFQLPNSPEKCNLSIFAINSNGDILKI